MKVVYNNIIPFKGFRAINLFGVIFARKDRELCDVELYHERIHAAQMKELLYIGFYLIYIIEWIYLLIRFKNSKIAYRNISFEIEAYSNQYNKFYLKNREPFSMWEK